MTDYTDEELAEAREQLYNEGWPPWPEWLVRERARALRAERERDAEREVSWLSREHAVTAGAKRDDLQRRLDATVAALREMLDSDAQTWGEAFAKGERALAAAQPQADALPLSLAEMTDAERRGIHRAKRIATPAGEVEPCRKVLDIHGALFECQQPAGHDGHCSATFHVDT